MARSGSCGWLLTLAVVVVVMATALVAQDIAPAPAAWTGT